jgi:3'-phosphoadenosine 5'-phosphosulfate sulfotransferase (PAPS reductase)/FAD synthetase
MNDPFKIIEPTSISFSGGRTSAYLLWRVLQTHNGKLPNDAKVIFANTGKESEQTLEFIKKCSEHWNVEIIWVEYISDEPLFKVVNFDTASRNGEPFEAVIRKYKKLPNPAQRWCTGVLKIRTMHKYLKSLGWEHHETNNADFVGIRYDEQRRAVKMAREKLPLVSAKITKQDVLNFWKNNSFDLELPVIEGETVGGNCDLCFLKSLPKILTLVNQDPKRAIWWSKMEKLVPDLEGVKKGNGSTFRSDRPTYEQIANNHLKQMTLNYEEDIACFCGD